MTQLATRNEGEGGRGVGEASSYVFRLPVEPVVLKNSKQIVRTRSGKTFIKCSDKVERITEAASFWLKREQQRLEMAGQLPVFPPDVWLNAKIIVAGPWRSDSENLPDLSNLYEFPQDRLEHYGIIANDRRISAHDGCRRICLCDNCPERPLITRGPNAGKRKDTCGHSRECKRPFIEITLTPMPELISENTSKTLFPGDVVR